MINDPITLQDIIVGGCICLAVFSVHALIEARAARREAREMLDAVKSDAAQIRKALTLIQIGEYEDASRILQGETAE